LVWQFKNIINIIKFKIMEAFSLGSIAGAVAAFGAAYGISKIGTAAMEAIARQPEAAGKIQSAMIIASALIEGAALFAIVVALMLK
jgi:F-type H+-transporting ATPase subunit c